MQVGIEQLHLSELRHSRTPPRVSVTLEKQTREYGQLLPVVVRELSNRHYEILANAETWIAVQKTGQYQVDIVIRNDLSDEDAQSLVNTRQTMDPMEEARSFKSLLNRSTKQTRHGAITALARSFNLSRSYVAHSLRLLSLPDPIQQQLTLGTLTVGHAKALLGLKPYPDAQIKVANHLVAQQWSVRKTESYIREILNKAKAKRSQAQSQTKSADTKKLERDVSDLIGSTFSINEQAGTVEIDYRQDLDVLTGLLERLGYR